MRLMNGILVGMVALAIGCAEQAVVDGDPASGASGTGGKEDSGWLGSDTFEVNAIVRSVVRQEAEYEWALVATDPTLQTKLVDSQLKFIKNTAESYGWRFNQLADTVTILSVSEDGGDVVIEYEAVVDMLGRLQGAVPTVEEIEDNIFAARVPADPMGFSYTQIGACSESDGSHSVSDYNFHYYFQPDQEGCDLPLTEATVTITEVFPRERTYPEYDQLLRPLDEAGTIGFKAALVPNVGDSDPMSRFDAHAEMLENQLDLVGEDAEDGTYRRYVWERDGATMIIDLYDPTQIPWESNFAANFRARLGEYSFVHYNGHSAYGTKHLLDHPESFSDAYQIIMMHSCQSYAYYTRQVFRAKRTETDPTGFALADVVATGKSSYPSGSPPTLRVLLDSLMAGISAISRGEPELAPDWMSIVEGMSDSTWGDIMYGVAGVRTNLWQPPAGEPETETE